MKLSPRQLQVMRLIGEGFRDKEIADRLEISMPMVTRHVKSAVLKLKASNRCHALAILIRQIGY